MIYEMSQNINYLCEFLKRSEILIHLEDLTFLENWVLALSYATLVKEEKAVKELFSKCLETVAEGQLLFNDFKKIYWCKSRVLE